MSIESLTALVDAVWDYSIRTLDALAPAASNGSYTDDIGYAVWTYSDRSVINPPITIIAEPYAIIGNNEIAIESTTVLEGGTITDRDHMLILVPKDISYPTPPSPENPEFPGLWSFATKDMSWSEEPDSQLSPHIADLINPTYTKKNKIVEFQTQPGTLLHEMWHQILQRLPVTNRNLFLTKNHTTKTYVRNLNTFAKNVDVSALSVWPDRPVTAITPTHGICANHWTPSNGSVQRFVSMNNEWVERTVVSSQYIGTDCRLVVFNEPLPSTIKPARLVPYDFVDYFDPLYINYDSYKAIVYDAHGSIDNYIGFYPYNFSFFPTIRVNRLDNEILTMMRGGAYFLGTQSDGYWVKPTETGIWYRHDENTIDEFPPWLPDNLEEYVYDTDSVQSGDSGHPMYIIVDDEMVVVSTAFSGYSNSQEWFGAAIDAAGPSLTAATSGQCRFVDLTRFPKLNSLPPIPS